ncbi:hypothetical protein BKA56DRAFT_347094 [Ilyonectria sp. MPI-CAGE-AT-0026]|nr:hypothetical protein BKA56DRAFT_347094 [Ilyonectria sp. MPI-CAGE-AT-0026]
MSSQGIRLRLAIRRHAVPEVKLVWPCVTSEDLTVAKLLAQVNEVVPLESGEWGLEDYAVELTDGNGGSFECLHFQQVGRILKEDDQILIRSLLTEDLRRRRLTGRHQISSDGRHLVDGLAFGRPWLRVPRDRPALDLPPRKRARLEYDMEEDEDDEDDEEDESFGDEDSLEDEELPEQLMLEGTEPFDADEPSSVGIHALFDDADRDADNEGDDGIDSDDNDFLPGNDAESSADEEEDVNLEDELRVLQEDNAVIGDQPSTEHLEFDSSDDDDLPRGLLTAQDLDLSSLDHIATLRSAFPLTSVTSIHTELLRQHKNLRATFQALAKSNDPTMSFDEMMDRALTGFIDYSQPALLGQETSLLAGLGTRESGSPDIRGLRGSARPMIEEVESIDTPVTGGPRMEAPSGEFTFRQVMNMSVEASSDDTSNSDSSSEASSDDSSSDDDSDDDSDDAMDSSDSESSDSSDSSDSDSDSDSSSGDDASVNNSTGHLEDDDDSSSDSDSSSSSDDSASEPEEVPSKKEAPVKALVVPEVLKQILATSTTSPPIAAPVPPGCGLTRTQKRNARRRDAKRLKESNGAQLQSPMISEIEDGDAELLARKKALLLSVVGEETPKTKAEQIAVPSSTEIHPKDTPTVETPQDAPPSSEPTSQQRRMKVDMGAGRRLLFGALGLKNPKSKADEDKLRKNLMKDVRPLENHRTQDVPKSNGAKEAEPEQPDEDPEAWREKISYRGVECCHEGMVLSEPPFPFVQRWDPQQQYGSMRKRKRESQNVYDESYCEEDSQWNEGGTEWVEPEQKKKKSKKRKGKDNHGDNEGRETNADADVILNYDDTPAKTRPEDSQFTDVDDLPSLPTDLTTLPVLEFNDVKPGMVVTWKQLLMSKATSWQPQLASLTGLVLSISDDDCVHVLLAKRDREENDKVYDEHTGKRVYDKFEAPDSDEDDEDEGDTGRRDVEWTEMTETRLVQPAPPSSSPSAPANGESVQAAESAPVADSIADNEVMAGVEVELRDLETTKTAPSDISTLIPSGQAPPRIEVTASNDWPNMAAQSTDSPIEGVSSPSQQLQEMSQVASTPDKGGLEVTSGEKDDYDVDQPVEECHAPEIDMEDWNPTPLKDSELKSVIPDSMPSLVLPQPSDPDNSRPSPVVEHPLAVASSVGSVRSGRQPPSNYGTEESHERIEDSAMGDTTPRARDMTPTPRDGPSIDEDRRSSSPFPSLDEIFHTAATSRHTQSPGKPAQMSAMQSLKASVRRDFEYEEAMRKLDEGEEESDLSSDKNKSIRSLFPNATQPEAEVDLPKLIPPKLETPPRSARSQRAKRSSPFRIPEGSQVISLSSSPDSSQFVEDYALDNDDETYKESPHPDGSGLSQKKDRDVTRRETRSRGKSVPATTRGKPMRTKLGRGRTSLPPAMDANASAVSQIKGRKKRGGKS